jgi:hypothetical protein
MLAWGTALFILVFAVLMYVAWDIGRTGPPDDL